MNDETPASKPSPPATPSDQRPGGADGAEAWLDPEVRDEQELAARRQAARERRRARKAADPKRGQTSLGLGKADIAAAVAGAKATTAAKQPVEPSPKAARRATTDDGAVAWTDPEARDEEAFAEQREAARRARQGQQNKRPRRATNVGIGKKGVQADRPRPGETARHTALALEDEDGLPTLVRDMSAELAQIPEAPPRARGAPRPQPRTPPAARPTPEPPPRDKPAAPTAAPSQREVAPRAAAASRPQTAA
ncbi:MAG: hypothetical protein JRI23_15130, partial [Deltaproteobacteria bacterium]|nr:hypothetical protein [Deltaproteobacteria bacterium]MBW2533081.1 hypothetical protein [Deltaproteobacteria bacterium]